MFSRAQRLWFKGKGAIRPVLTGVERPGAAPPPGRVRRALELFDQGDVPAGAGLLGFALLTVGVAQISRPAGFIVAGVLLLAFYVKRSV